MVVILSGMFGLFMGAAFSAIYGIIYLLTGGMPAVDGSIIGPLDAATVYLAMCFIGGLVMGALRTLFRSGVGAALVGVLGTAPMMLGSGALYAGSFGQLDWLAVAVGSLLIGVPMGFIIRKEVYRGLRP
jgi:hypothetical protein